MTENGTSPKPEPRVFSEPEPHEVVTTTDFTLARDEWGQLTFTGPNGIRRAPVAPTPLFPISYPDKWISIRSDDNIEVACIEDPEQLEPEVWKLLKLELARREFVPVIDRIVRVSGNTEPCEFVVETDRGSTKFVLKSEDDVRRIGDHQIIIIDAHGTRYLIPDLRTVDTKTRRIIEWYV